jgi:nitrous oxide reductase accessory protein NosL
MRKVIPGGIVVSLLALTVLAAYGQLAADIQQHPACKYCGMDRQKFDFSRMLIEYSDGSSMGSCSLHCTAVDLANSIDKTPQVIKVADFNTKALVDGEKAVWVLGGKKPGVMTKRAKWAFEKKPDAEKFVKENEGQMVGFEDAMKASYEDMYADTKMIRERRKARLKKQQEKQP